MPSWGTYAEREHLLCPGVLKNRSVSPPAQIELVTGPHFEIDWDGVETEIDPFISARPPQGVERLTIQKPQYVNGLVSAQHISGVLGGHRFDPWVTLDEVRHGATVIVVGVGDDKVADELWVDAELVQLRLQARDFPGEVAAVQNQVVSFNDVAYGMAAA